VKNLEEEQKSNNFKDKYESAAIELEQLRQVLKLKEEELSNLAKIRKQYNVEGNKNLNKEIKQLETRLIET
jgi:L-lysine 2,3-aminomutase